MLPVNMLFWLIQISCGLFDAPRQHVVLVDTNILWVVDAPRQHDCCLLVTGGKSHSLSVSAA